MVCLEPDFFYGGFAFGRAPRVGHRALSTLTDNDVYVLLAYGLSVDDEVCVSAGVAVTHEAFSAV